MKAEPQNIEQANFEGRTRLPAANEAKPHSDI